jgi:hypothetical protein
MFTSYQWEFEAKKNHLLMLYSLVSHDDVVSGYKEHFISNIATSLGLTEVELDEVIDSAACIECPIPKDEGSRVGYFYHLLFLLSMHGKLADRDRELCRSMGFRLCLNPLMVNELIELTFTNEGREIPKDEMLNTVKRHYN